MPKLEEVYTRLQKSKKERREVAKMIKDEVNNNTRYQELLEEMKTLRDEKKAIEQEARAGSDGEKLDELKADIQTDQELLSDLALNMYANKEAVEIVDEYDQKWYPEFKVTFKKGS